MVKRAGPRVVKSDIERPIGDPLPVHRDLDHEMRKLSRASSRLSGKHHLHNLRQCPTPTRLRGGALGVLGPLMIAHVALTEIQIDQAETIGAKRGPNTTDQGVEIDSGRGQGVQKAKSAGEIERSKAPLPSQVDAFKSTDKDSPSPGSEKQKPNFRPSGLLAAAANTVATSTGAIVLKYHEPPEARKPPSSQTWRLYVFKGDEILDTLDLYTQSCWLFGREVSVCDYALEHPSCSKQHAVIQFRHIERRNEFGDKIGKVKPYVIDLESANGTKVNEEAIPEGRYVELRDKDVIKFGHSTREYVLQLPPR